MVKRIGRYEIKSELGRGAFGRVYRAWDPNVKRAVAVKLLTSEANPNVLSRFQAEAGMTGNLLHKNIVTVYELAEHDGIPYLVMELLEGETLQQIIAAHRPLALLDKVEIMYQVAEGLQSAHAKGVIHRDIKPGNIMVLPNGNVKIMDFGIARVMDREGTRRTQQGDLVGTILYMAPEQFQGGDAERRTDIFAYGVIYYELLTGVHPFAGKDVGAVMYRITSHDPPPLRELLPESPEALDNVLRRLIAKDREMRIDRMEDVIFDCQPILHQLRQTRAAEIAAEIRPLAEAGNFEAAQVPIRQVLELDPFNTEARSWRKRIQLESERKIIRIRAETLARKGKEHMAARHFSEALESFEGALALDKSDENLPTLVNEAKTALANSRNAARLVAEAHWEVQQGNLESALEKATRASGLDPGNSNAAAMCERLAQELRERQAAAAVANAEKLHNHGEYTAALAELERVDPRSVLAAKATALQFQVEADRVEAEHRADAARFQAALEKARDALYAHDLALAVQEAQALCAKFPGEPAATTFQSEVRERIAAQRRIDGITDIIHRGRSLIKAKAFNEARTCLQSSLQAYPTESGIRHLLDIAESLDAAQERVRVITVEVQQANDLREQALWDDALQNIDRAIQQYGQDSALLECKRDLEFEREEEQYSAGLHAVLSESRRLISAERASEAVSMLEQAICLYPDEAEFLTVLSSARQAAAAIREGEYIKETLGRVSILETAEQLNAAHVELEVGLIRYGKNADLLAASERLAEALRRRERERAMQSSAPRN